MAEYYAHIDENGIVDSVIVIDTQTFLDSNDWYVNGVSKHHSEWKQTNIDTKEGSNGKGETPLRKNYAGIGHKYDQTLDAFLIPKTYNSWTLDEQKGTYFAPKTQPNDGNEYKWDENLLDWVLTKDL